MNIAIVITAYNRPSALRELLSSLKNVRTSRDIPLIISIDNGGTEDVNKLAGDYDWNHGEKKVIIHNHKKGLVKHFIWTGDQTKDYDVVVFLEDDLLVSPEIINYVEQVYDFYKGDTRVAAASLYNPFIFEYTGCRFYQLEDGYDNYFLQQPYWGHVWFKKPWEDFTKYLKSYKVNKDILPSGVSEWTESFKKIYIQFLIETDKYVVTPRTSLLTNNGIPGLHSGNREYFFQSSFCLEPKKYKFSTLDNSLSIYDCSWEILPSILCHYNKSLSLYDFEVDLWGAKRKYNKPYVLTSKPVKTSILSFSSQMKPTELSIVMNQIGDSGVNLCRAENVIESNKFVRERRFNDILKNYPLSVIAGFLAFKYSCQRLLHVFKTKFIH